MRLDDPYMNYIIISAYQSLDNDFENRLAMSKLADSLLFNDFTILEMGGKQPSYLAYKDCDDNSLRYDAIEMMDRYHQEFVIVKYLNETEAKKIHFNGSEGLLGVVEYVGDDNHHNFYVEGMGFAFEPKKRYWKPSGVTDLKKDMVVEILDNNNQWVERVVKDPEVEFQRLYKMMLKYDKMRIAHNGDYLK